MLKYAEVRDIIRTGDLVFFKGNYIGSRLIQAFTKSPWSHVAIVTVLSDRVVLLEAEPGVGVRIVPMSKYMYSYRNDTGYKGEIFLYRHNELLYDDQITSGLNAVLDCVTSGYDWWGCVATGLHTLFGLHFASSKKAYHCAELVDVFFHAASIDVRGDNMYITPEDIAKLPEVSLIGQVIA